MLTTKQVAEKYGVCTRTVDRWCDRDGAPFQFASGRRGGRERRFDEVELDRFMRRLPPESLMTMTPRDIEVETQVCKRLHILLERVQQLTTENATLKALNSNLAAANRRWAGVKRKASA